MCYRVLQGQGHVTAILFLTCLLSYVAYFDQEIKSPLVLADAWSPERKQHVSLLG